MRFATARSTGLFWILLFCGIVHSQALVINEFLASNDACCTDEHGDYDDWVELYNAGDVPVDLAGLWFSDQAGVSGWQIPDDDDEITTVAPGGFIVVWFDEQLDQGLLHVDDKLSAGGESIVIYQPDGVTEVARHDFGPQTTDVSEGRQSDGAGDWVSFSQPSPGASNNVTAVSARMMRPRGLTLRSVSPNPFNPSTRLVFSLAATSHVVLGVHDLCGRRVDTRDLGLLDAGEQQVSWQPAASLASGVYWLNLDAGSQHAVRRVLYIK
ncbi:MAG: lamin tail domain-containing protein [Calditrichaeota bacterium]|nr:lamin tail domain-containing protein [Calditrichota bacterium]